jgi:hypothetical protein
MQLSLIKKVFKVKILKQANALRKVLNNLGQTLLQIEKVKKSLIFLKLKMLFLSRRDNKIKI